MKKLIILYFILIFSACGVSKNEYNKLIYENDQLKAEILKLSEEIDQYKYGEDRTIALIDKAISEKDIELARVYVDIFNKYHPQSTNNQNYVRLIRIVEQEERKIKEIREAEEREKIRQERLANIGKEADNPIIINANWRKISQVIVDIILNRETYDNKYINLVNVVFDSFNVASNAEKVRGFDWLNNNDTFGFLLTTNAFANELTANNFRIYIQPNNEVSKRYFLQLNGKYVQPAKRMSMKSKYYYYTDRNGEKQNILIVYEIEIDGDIYFGNLP